MKNFKKIFVLIAIFGFLAAASSASAQACYSNFNGANSYYDAAYTYRVNTTFSGPFSYTMTTPTNNRIKIGGISMHWRYSTDAATVQRAITTLPSYSNFTKSGEGTSSGRGNLYFSKLTTRGIFYISYKFLTERGDVLTAINKITVS